MSMRFSKCLYFIVVVVLVVSCKTSDIVTLPENPPKIVVNCVTENDSLFTASVSLSSGILNKNPNPNYYGFVPISTAKVDLYENGQFLETLTPYTNPYPTSTPDDQLADDYYAKNARARIGKTYTIEVTQEGYNMVSSTYTQPPPIAVDSFSTHVGGLDPRPEYAEDSVLENFYHFEFNDPPGENYYEVVFFIIHPGYSSEVLSPKFINSEYKESNLGGQEGDPGIVFADTYFDGKRAILDLKSAIGRQWVKGTWLYGVYLRNVTREYYFYRKNLNQQVVNASDPFAQPTNVQNNISNGFGIFAGFTQTVKTCYSTFP
jgi:Domain of unknown function (DUF4249)